MLTAVKVKTRRAEQMTVASTLRQSRIPLSTGARKTNLTPQGLLKILRRNGSAIRDDGRWYVDPAIIDQIAVARQVLGFARTKRSKRKEKPPVGERPNQPDDSLRPPQVVPGSESPA
jgi:hypothetical protein